MPALTELPGAPYFSAWLKKNVANLVIEGPNCEDIESKVKIKEDRAGEVLVFRFNVKSEANVLGEYTIELVRGGSRYFLSCRLNKIEYVGRLPVAENEISLRREDRLGTTDSWDYMTLYLKEYICITAGKLPKTNPFKKVPFP